MLTSWSLVCWLPKGRRFRAEVTIECGIFLGFSVLWGVFPVRDRFLMFSCILVFSSRSSSFCVLWQVEANISKFLFRRRTLSWQLLQQNLGSSSLSLVPLWDFNITYSKWVTPFHYRWKSSFFSWSSHQTTGTYFLKYRLSNFGTLPCLTTARAAIEKTAKIWNR